MNGDEEGLYAVRSEERVSDSERLFSNPLTELGSEDKFVSDA